MKTLRDIAKFTFRIGEQSRGGIVEPIEEEKTVICKIVKTSTKRNYDRQNGVDNEAQNYFYIRANLTQEKAEQLVKVVSRKGKVYDVVDFEFWDFSHECTIKLKERDR